MTHVLAAYLHDLDPFLLRISDGFGLRWYGLSYVAGFVAAYYLVRWIIKRGASPIAPDRAGDLVLAIAIGTIVGGRLGYCIFYDPRLLIDFSADLPFWGVLALNRGGMASHGGIIGIVLAGLWFARKNRVPALHPLDLAAWTGMLGILFGRLANFINGELYGRPCSGDFPLAVKFPQEIRDWPAERLADLTPAVESLGHSAADWHNAVSAMSADSGSRSWVAARLAEIIQQVQNHQPGVIAAIEPVLTPRHPSQLYQAFTEGLLLFVALGLIWARPRKPGVVGGWFMVLYAIGRITTEQFRTPDAHIGFQAWGLTRGQWLSIVMLAAGIALLAFWSTRDVPRIGGWLRPALPALSCPSAEGQKDQGAAP